MQHAKVPLLSYCLLAIAPGKKVCPLPKLVWISFKAETRYVPIFFLHLRFHNIKFLVFFLKKSFHVAFMTSYRLFNSLGD